MTPEDDIKKELIHTWGKFGFFLVDDEMIRNSAEYAEEFSDYGLNLGARGLSTLNFKFIPENEVWIARSIKPSERHFIMDNALSYIKNIERGVPSGEAYDNALKHEQSMRARDVKNKLHVENSAPPKNPDHAAVNSKVYFHKYLSLSDDEGPVEVYPVNGEFVRDLYKTDFVEGGHGFVYDWIPRNEIWVDDKLPQDEIPVIILHEFTERTLMKCKKTPYVRAHMEASKVEFEHRGIFDWNDAEHLTTDIVMRKLLKNNRFR